MASVIARRSRDLTKSRDITLPTKVHIIKAMVFLVVMYTREGWIIKNGEFWRRLLRVPWTARRSNQWILKEINPEIFIGRTDVLWPPDSKSRLSIIISHWCWAYPAGGRQEEKGTTEHDKAGWRQQLNRHEFEQTLGESEGLGILACFTPWDWKELDTT